MAGSGAPAWLMHTAGGWLLRVHAQPGAARSEVVGPHGDALKVRIAAPPVEGKANAELVAHLAVRLALPRSSVTVRRGASGRAKQVEIAADLSQADVLARLGPQS